MFDRLEIRVLSPGPRFAAQLRFWVNGEDVVDAAVGEGGRGPYAADANADNYVTPGYYCATSFTYTSRQGACNTVS
ncbi:hypothetical protein ACFXKR_40560 [Streptomyces violascens]|uniref:hypothetical protein n=1 Tax=Streptomyces violascens TaxID=67381 RepID=UPI0036CDBC7D